MITKYNKDEEHITPLVDISYLTKMVEIAFKNTKGGINGKRKANR